ncbi:MAG: hypothetical protein J0I99_12425 [Devosia sp.]|uniref:hypothetical protein n=1 Tax=Devosia sp. TaxID=1871048 RepID=UPI001AD3E246|nr:hypothetical protein [Devosia sp.]MBN9316540.1 hypothetical protein [Devosia sp.]
MAWYLNHYHCQDCNAAWSDEWSCCCDDDCPQCGSRHWSPYASEDLTEIVREQDGLFVVMRSPDSADHKPRYEPIARFTSNELANRFIVDGELT